MKLLYVGCRVRIIAAEREYLPLVGAEGIITEAPDWHPCVHGLKYGWTVCLESHPNEIVAVDDALEPVVPPFDFSTETHQQLEPVLA
jgi:hypothetical protein